MNSEELTAAFESLQKLENHYKNQYQDYLAKAMSAKANLDRLESLLKDVSSQFALYPEEQESFLEFETEEKSTNGNSPQLELDWMMASLDNNEPNAEPEPNDEKVENQEISHREFVKLSSQVMPILQSIFAQDLGKKLHLSYLYKAVNQKTELGLSQDTVELFLDEAVSLGYCERDIYDKSCYYSVPDDKALVEEALEDNPYKRTFEKKTTTNDGEEQEQLKQEDSVTLTKPTHNLPLSPKVKMTIPDTIFGYLAERQPKSFTVRDVVNYLYSDSEQAQWSKKEKSQITTSISNTLRANKYEHWKQAQPGFYQSLLNRESSDEVSSSIQTSHDLPSSPRVKMTIPDTILGYIDSYHPKTFKAEDVVNYLYSETEQKHWSKEQRIQVRHSITAGLSYYNNRNWKRVRAGVYRPLKN